MLSLVPFVFCLVGIFSLREILPENSTTEQDKEETSYFSFSNGVAVVVAVYMLAFGFMPIPNALASRVFVVVLVVLLATPLGIPVHYYLKARGFKAVLDVNELLLGKHNKRVRKSVTDEEASAVVTMTVKSGPVVGEEHTIWEALKTLDFWILFVSNLCGVGTSLVVMYNMRQIRLALGYSNVSLFVSLTSI
ncbi:hypothetical protein RJT34_12542 [Clitoria ternatea]|uniref:Nodulin-like domain-containing protein n=1 Tax=Clitoria ternatea TaxID=43366 RepID=A0AAN9PKL2_CLITE